MNNENSGNYKYMKHITNTFLGGKLSCTVVIPIKMARKYGIDKPCNVVITDTGKGILITKLDI